MARCRKFKQPSLTLRVTWHTLSECWKVFDNKRITEHSSVLIVLRQWYIYMYDERYKIQTAGLKQRKKMGKSARRTPLAHWTPSVHLQDKPLFTGTNGYNGERQGEGEPIPTGAMPAKGKNIITVWEQCEFHLARVKKGVKKALKKGHLVDSKKKGTLHLTSVCVVGGGGRHASW